MMCEILMSDNEITSPEKPLTKEKNSQHIKKKKHKPVWLLLKY